MRERVLSEKLHVQPPARVLVIQTAFLGDTVFTSALVGSLSRRFPGAEIDLCVAPRGRDIAVRPLWRFVRGYVLRLGFLDGAAGAAMAWARSYEAFRRYTRLWELSRFS